eukprot:gene38985-51268_t
MPTYTGKQKDYKPNLKVSWQSQVAGQADAKDEKRDRGKQRVNGGKQPTNSARGRDKTPRSSTPERKTKSSLKQSTSDFRVHNLAFHDLTPKGTAVPFGLKGLLGLGLKFCPTPSPVQSSVYIDALLPLFRSIRLGLMFKEDNQSYSKLIYVPNTAYQPQPAPQYIEGFMKYCLKKAHSSKPPPRPARCNLNR